MEAGNEADTINAIASSNTEASQSQPITDSGKVENFEVGKAEVFPPDGGEITGLGTISAVDLETKTVTLKTDSEPQKKDSKPKPREMRLIETDYAQLCSMAGEAFFQMEFHKGNLEQMVWQHKQLTREGSERAKIDKELGAEAVSKAQEKRDRKAAKRAEALKAGLTEVEADALMAADEPPQTEKVAA